MKLFATACAVVTVSVGAFGQGVPSGTAVETYSASSTVQFQLPGTPSGLGLAFSATTVPSRISFTPGTVNFNGQPIEFHGHESEFLANTYSGNCTVPVTHGPATVTVNGSGSISGSTTWSGTWTLEKVALGSNFSASNIDIPTGTVKVASSTGSVWNSTSVPNLNGAKVVLQSTCKVTSVDAADGTVNKTSTGTAYAQDGLAPIASNGQGDNTPTTRAGLPLAGIALLCVGMLGLILTAGFRQHRGQSARNA